MGGDGDRFAVRCGVAGDAAVEVHGDRRRGEAPAVAEVPAELLSWLRDLVADGLCTDLGRGWFRLRVTQAELARRSGLSPGSGTVPRRLGELSRLGVVVSRRPVVFRLPAGETRRRPADAPVTAASASRRRSTLDDAPAVPGDGLVMLVQLCDRAISERSDAIALAALGCLDRLLATRYGRVPGADPGAEACTGSVSEARFLRGSCSSVAKVENNLSPCSCTDSSSLFSPWSGHVGVYEPGADSGADPGADPGADRDPVGTAGVSPVVLVPGNVTRPVDGISLHAPGQVVVERPAASTDAARVSAVFEALEPLLEACERLGLPGVNNPKGLLRAVEHVALDDLRAGALLVASQLGSNVALRSPVGAFVALARRGEFDGLSGLSSTLRRTDCVASDPTTGDVVSEHVSEAPRLGRVVDSWWDELSRLERDDPAALCALTGDAEPWLAKIRAYGRRSLASDLDAGRVVEKDALTGATVDSNGTLDTVYGHRPTIPDDSDDDQNQRDRKRCDRG